MKDYMTPSTIQNWYRYAMDVRGREVENGDIRLVYACDKAASWGIATFSSVEGNTTSFAFNQTKDFQSGSHTYNWTCSGSVNTHMRVGPSVEEEAIRNQCIFLQTWNVQLSGMGFFAWYASASSATATQFKFLRAVPKFCVHCKGEVLSAVLFYGVS